MALSTEDLDALRRLDEDLGGDRKTIALVVTTARLSGHTIPEACDAWREARRELNMGTDPFGRYPHAPWFKGCDIPDGQGGSYRVPNETTPTVIGDA